ncbi:MAG: hypothetical protein R3Y13_01815 [bacterium]
MSSDTLELIPLTMIQKIFEDNTYSKLLILKIREKEDKFNDYDIVSIVNAINNYFDFFHKKYDEELSDKDYIIINNINNSYGKDTVYTRVEKNVSIDRKNVDLEAMTISRKLLEDNNYCEMFLSSEKLVFEGIKVDLIIEKIKDLFELYYGHNTIPKNIITNYNRIIIQKDPNLLDEYKKFDFDDELNQKIKKEILSNINKKNDKFSVARELYLTLGRVLRYKAEFVFYEKSDKKAKEIYDTSIEEVTIKNNEVTCYAWSKIYASLLTELGIEAFVSGNYHKYVIFRVDDLLIKADATNAFYNKEGIKINDLLNIPLDLPTVGFINMNHNPDFEEYLSEVDEKLDYRRSSFNEKVNSLSEYYGAPKDLSFEEGMKVLRQVDTSSLKGLEYCAYISKLVKLIFNQTGEYAYTDFVFKKGLKKEVFIILYHVDNIKKSYVRCTDSGIKELTEKEYLKLSSKKSVKFHYNTDLTRTGVQNVR